MEHVKSLLPEGKRWKLVWNDEFDGTELDRTKWDFRLHLLQQRHVTYTDQAARLDGNSHLELFLLKKDGHFYSSHLQTGSNYLDRPGQSFCFDGAGAPKLKWPVAPIVPPKFMHKYGYYECRCKLQTQPGWWSAFWLQSPIIGCSLDPKTAGVECDIMENFTRDGKIGHMLHWNGYGSDHRDAGSGQNLPLEETPDKWHVFGVDWAKDGYTFYVDGKKHYFIPGPVSDTEQFILIGTECLGYRESDQPCEDLKKAVLPDAFIVDYVRVFDEVDEKGDPVY